MRKVVVLVLDQENAISNNVLKIFKCTRNIHAFLRSIIQKVSQITTFTHPFPTPSYLLGRIRSIKSYLSDVDLRVAKFRHLSLAVRSAVRSEINTQQFVWTAGSQPLSFRYSLRPQTGGNNCVFRRWRWRWQQLVSHCSNGHIYLCQPC